MGTDKMLFRPVPVPRNGARVLPLEAVPVPGHGAQNFARAPTKSSVHKTKLRTRFRTLLRTFTKPMFCLRGVIINDQTE